jgi:hypothetical protein
VAEERIIRLFVVNRYSLLAHVLVGEPDSTHGSSPRGCFAGTCASVAGSATSQGSFMTNHVYDVQIDRAHSVAICKEIGDRLRVSLVAERDHLPPGLSLLLEQLAKAEAAGTA